MSELLSNDMSALLNIKKRIFKIILTLVLATKKYFLKLFRPTNFRLHFKTSNYYFKSF